MSAVRIVYYRGNAARRGDFVDDFRRAGAEALARNDTKGSRRLRNLLLSYVEVQLASMNARQLHRHLSSRPVWKKTEHWNVYRTPDTPTLCMAAKEDLGGDITLVVLGARYRHPAGGVEGWWRDVIEPRVRSLT